MTWAPNWVGGPISVNHECKSAGSLFRTTQEYLKNRIHPGALEADTEVHWSLTVIHSRLHCHLLWHAGIFIDSTFHRYTICAAGKAGKCYKAERPIPLHVEAQLALEVCSGNQVIDVLPRFRQSPHFSRGWRLMRVLCTHDLRSASNFPALLQAV